MNKQTEIIIRRYNRSAIYYDWMDRIMSDKLRKQVLSLARRKVLEVGVGTGTLKTFSQQKGNTK